MSITEQDNEEFDKIVGCNYIDIATYDDEICLDGWFTIETLERVIGKYKQIKLRENNIGEIK